MTKLQNFSYFYVNILSVLELTNLFTIVLFNQKKFTVIMACATFPLSLLKLFYKTNTLKLLFFL